MHQIIDLSHDSAQNEQDSPSSSEKASHSTNPNRLIDSSHDSAQNEQDSSSTSEKALTSANLDNLVDTSMDSAKREQYSSSTSEKALTSANLDNLVDTSMDSAKREQYSSSTSEKATTSANFNNIIDSSLDSAQTEQASQSIAEQVANSTMGPERSGKRIRPSSEEVESVMFAQAYSITAATHNEGSRPAKRERLSARKGGWSAAEKPAHQRNIAEYTAKKPGWEMKLSKCKNKLARSIVQNAFMTHAPDRWSGTRFPQHVIVAEKERGVGVMGQSIVGRGMKAQQTTAKIEKRYQTYYNDALRYAKIVSKIERFERWGKTRKLQVRTTIKEEMERQKTKELSS